MAGGRATTAPRPSRCSRRTARGAARPAPPSSPARTAFRAAQTHTQQTDALLVPTRIAPPPSGLTRPAPPAQFAPAGSSCVVRLGGTCALATVTATLEPPFPDRPSEGSLRFNVDFSPMASPAYQQGAPHLPVYLPARLPACLSTSLPGGRLGRTAQAERGLPGRRSRHRHTWGRLHTWGALLSTCGGGSRRPAGRRCHRAREAGGEGPEGEPGGGPRGAVRVGRQEGKNNALGGNDSAPVWAGPGPCGRARAGALHVARAAPDGPRGPPQ